MRTSLIYIPRTAMLFCISFAILGFVFLAGSDSNEAKMKQPLASRNALVTFAAMGDVPRSEKESRLLRMQLKEVPTSCAFVIHLGDIKNGDEHCPLSIYTDVAEILRVSPVPVFIVPGDNEYNDCENPLEAWKNWAQTFMRFDRKWNHNFPVFRQLEREENFSLVLNNTLFVGVNVVGGRIFDRKEWKERLDQDATWVERNLKVFGAQTRRAVIFAQAFAGGANKPFGDRFVRAAKAFGKPVLYLHGDGHHWICDRPFPDAPNVTRVQVDRGGIAPPVVVTVTKDDNKPFEFDRRLSTSARK